MITAQVINFKTGKVIGGVDVLKCSFCGAEKTDKLPMSENGREGKDLKAICKKCVDKCAELMKNMDNK